MNAHLERPRFPLHHLNALETGSLHAAGEGRSGREEAKVNAATEVDEQQCARLAVQQTIDVERLLALEKAADTNEASTNKTKSQQEEFPHAPVSQDDVVRLDVTVNDVNAVQVLDDTQELDGDVEGEEGREIERAEAVRVDEVEQRVSATHLAHKNTGVVVEEATVHTHDGGTLQDASVVQEEINFQKFELFLQHPR